MQQKNRVIERSRLFDTILPMTSSDLLCNLTSQRFPRYNPQDHEGREAEAKRLREIIENCETEEEMIRRIGELD